MKNNIKLGFSLLEVSVVLLIIGILLASVSAGKNMIRTSKLTSAQSLTNSSPVAAVDSLVLWMEPILPTSFAENETYQNQTLSYWRNVTNSYTPANLTSSGTPVYNELGINELPSVVFNSGDTFNINAPMQNIVGTNFAIFIVERRAVDGTIIDSDNLDVRYDSGFEIDKNGTVDVISSAVAAGDIDPAISYISFASSTMNAAPVGLTYYRNKGVLVSGNQINSTAADATSINSITSLSGVTLGAAASGYDGDIAEIIVYNKSLTFDELDEVLVYLSKKYRITLDKS